MNRRELVQIKDLLLFVLGTVGIDTIQYVFPHASTYMCLTCVMVIYIAINAWFNKRCKR